MKFMLNLLQDPSLTKLNVDGQDRFALHQGIFARKRMLREVFGEFHRLFDRMERLFLTAEGLKIEIGAGVAPMRDSYPHVLATDVVHWPNLDRQLDAEKMDLDDGSVRVFFGQNCFHHFKHPDLFFQELIRVLAPGGGAILLEPYYGFWASLLYQRLFKSESFDKDYPSWEMPVGGPMSEANQALSYIVFVRDFEKFRSKYPQLKVLNKHTVGNYLKYLLSGGLNFRQLCPDSLSGIIDALQWCLSPLNRWLALHWVVVIRKDI